MGARRRGASSRTKRRAHARQGVSRGGRSRRQPRSGGGTDFATLGRSMEKRLRDRAPPTDRASDARHVARSGVLQLLSALGQGLMPVTHILIARLFGAAIFGAYQASVAILEVLTRAGLVGSMHGMHRFIPAHRAEGDADLEQRALGTGIRLTVAVSSVLAARAGVCWRRWSRAPGTSRAWPRRCRSWRRRSCSRPRRWCSSRRRMGAKVARMSLYVRGLAEPILLLLAVVLAWRLGGTCRASPSRTSPARAWSRRWPWRPAHACSVARYLRRALRAPTPPGFAALRAAPRGVRSDERRAATARTRSSSPPSPGWTRWRSTPPPSSSPASSPTRATCSTTSSRRCWPRRSTCRTARASATTWRW